MNVFLHPSPCILVFFGDKKYISCPLRLISKQHTMHNHRAVFLIIFRICEATSLGAAALTIPSKSER